jgi:TetR/AcrR family transcriptional repressor of nem operon
MARQISYDPLYVRQRLLQQFWEHGFVGTSLAELEEASGLNRRQLYNGLGDKRDMFLQALDDFNETAGRRFLGPLEAKTADLNSVRGLLETFVQLAESGEGRLGCFVCSTSQEEVAADPEIRARLDRYFERIVAAYANALSGAVAKNQLSLPPPDVTTIAHFLLGVQIAMSVMARAGQSPDQIRDLAEFAIKAVA